MTAREKLAMEHPDLVCPYSPGGSEACPNDLGYLPRADYCVCDEYGDPVADDNRCTRCWDREIPEVDPKEIAEEYKHVKEGKMTVNEAREALGLPRILDSGNRRLFESGAVRDIQEGKGRCDLLPLDVVRDFFYMRSNGVNKSEDYKRNRVFGHLGNFIKTGDDDHLIKTLIAAEMFKDPFDMFLEVAKHFEEGCKKYGENNWQKGIPVHCYIDSGVRHYLKFLRGDKDEPHDRAFCWNMMCAIWTCKHKPELNEYTKVDVNDP